MRKINSFLGNIKKPIIKGLASLGLTGLLLTAGAGLPAQAETLKLENSKIEIVNPKKTLEKISESGLNPYFFGKSKKTEQKKNKPTFFAFGTYNFGLIEYLPCVPLEGTYQPGSAYMTSAQSYDLSYSFGIGIDYKILPDIGVFLDGGFNSWKKLIAKKGGYGVGAWVWEQSGYEDARIGPFPMDTYYYMDTTDLRAGARFIFSKGKIEPWIGAGYGVYAWQATIGNKEEEKKYGTQSSGVTTGLSFLGGMDLNFNDFIIRFFGEFGAPVANPKIENLFQEGWTFENFGGEHITAPYKLGIAIGTK